MVRDFSPEITVLPIGTSVFALQAAPRQESPVPRHRTPQISATGNELKQARGNLRVTPFYLRAILIVMHQYPRSKTTSPNLRVAPFYLRAILIIIHQYTRLKTISPNLRVALFYLRVHFKAYVLLGSVVPPELSTTSFCIRILRRFTTV